MKMKACISSQIAICLKLRSPHTANRANRNTRRTKRKKNVSSKRMSKFAGEDRVIRRKIRIDHA